MNLSAKCVVYYLNLYEFICKLCGIFLVFLSDMRTY